MDFLFELLFEIYLNIGEILVPDHKFKKWQETLLKVACVLVSVTVIACIIAGICILTETAMKATGIILITVGSVFLTVQIVLFVIVFIRQIKSEKRNKEIAENNDK